MCVIFSTLISVGLGATEDWRQAWSLRIKAETLESDGFPKSLNIRILNRSDRQLRGQQLVLTVYRGNDFYAWASDDALRELRLAINPGDEVTRRVIFKDLVFTDPSGKVRNWAIVRKQLTRSRWTMVATITDVISPTPTTEFLYQVSSNTLEYGPRTRVVSDEQS